MATILGLLPVLGLTALIGSTEGWTPKYGWSTAVKQVAKSDSTSIYTYVEQIPELPTGGRPGKYLRYAQLSGPTSTHARWSVGAGDSPHQLDRELAGSAHTAGGRGQHRYEPAGTVSPGVIPTLEVINQHRGWATRERLFT